MKLCDASDTFCILTQAAPFQLPPRILFKDDPPLFDYFCMSAAGIIQEEVDPQCDDDQIKLFERIDFIYLLIGAHNIDQVLSISSYG